MSGRIGPHMNSHDCDGAAAGKADLKMRIILIIYLAIALALIAAGVLMLSRNNAPAEPFAAFADYLPGRRLPNLTCESPQLYYYGTGSDFFCRLPASLPCRYVYVAGRERTIRALMLYRCTLLLGDALALKGRPVRVTQYRQKSVYAWPDGSY